MVKKLAVPVLALAVILAFGVAGCLEEGSPPPAELIPEGANLIASIELGKILEDADLRGAYDEAAKEADMSATFEEALPELEEETGIDLSKLSRVWLFMDMSRLEGFAPYLGIIVEGSFDEGELVATIEEAGEEFATTEYKGYRIYILDEEDGEAFAFLDDGVLVVGSMDAVEDVIDVAEGDRPSVSGEAYDLYTELGEPLIKIAVELSPGLRQQVEQQMAEASQWITDKLPPELSELITGGLTLALPSLFTSFADMSGAGLALDKRGETVTIRLEAGFTNPDSAQSVADMVMALKIGSALLMPIEEVGDLVGQIEVSVEGSSASITLEVSVSQIEDLIQALQAFGELPVPTP
ncbi:MAG: hypothetical protein V3T71_05290 [Dehalococcoidia bacterium]